jgi:hypothetical protein
MKKKRIYLNYNFRQGTGEEEVRPWHRVKIIFLSLTHKMCHLKQSNLTFSSPCIWPDKDQEDKEEDEMLI